MNPLIVAVVAFEARRWNLPGAKDQAVHDLFGVSATRYYAAVNRIIDQPGALELDPVSVHRLRRLRETRRRRRVA